MVRLNINLNNSREVLIRTAKSSRKVYIIKCLDCGINDIKCEKKYLKKHSGKCIYCAHKGIPYKSSFNHFKDSVNRTNLKRNRNLEFNLTFEDFLSFTKIKNCFYCNHKITWVKHTGRGQHRYNLDRKNSNKGYYKDNLVVCCKKCNYMKSNYYSSEEFKQIIILLDKLRNGEVIQK